MVETRLTLEPEVQEILVCIDNNRNFLLSGGAGSGKTYSLVQVIRQVILEYPISKVACMTYTNAAVKEIEERVNHKNLNVTTIHDFLWDNIKHYQKELKSAIIALANNEENTKVNIDEPSPIPDNYFDNLEDGIQYKEFLKLKEGIISHDELLIVSQYIFEHYPKLGDIIKDKFKFIFIDEYQDTNPLVIDIFLVQLKKSSKVNVIGFFGDAMQSIYDESIGNLNEFKGVEIDKVKEIKKEQNRRSPQKVIDLANRLRTDGIIQVPSTDNKAPNMLNGVIKDGTIHFLHSTNANVDLVKNILTDNYGWNFADSKETKELNLTHNLIADKAGFRNLMNIYDGDKIIDFRKRVKTYIADNNITTDFSQNTFGEVLTILQQGKSGTALRPVTPTNSMQIFIDSHLPLYEIAKQLNFQEFNKIYVDKDQLLDDKKQDETDENKKGSKRDNLIKHLFKIQNNISLYENKQYNEFLRKTDFKDKIVSIQSKRILKQNIDELINVGEKTIEDVISDADAKGICIIDESLQKFKTEKSYIYNQVKEVKYSEFQKLYQYLEGKTPFSTQHKTKGGKSAQCDHPYPVEVDHCNPEQTDQSNPVQTDHPVSCI
jgi:DNA helicase-2/ATP-dependent DNA helicase PcrA